MTFSQPPRAGDDADGPRMLPTIDPSSDVGKSLNDAIARLRFANVDREVRDLAQKVLEGKASARDLMALPEFQPLLEAGRLRLRAEVESMTDEERAALFGPRPDGGPRSAGAGRGER